MCNRFYITYIFADNNQVPPDVSDNSRLHSNTREDLASPSCSIWNQNTGRGFTGLNTNLSRDADVDLSRHDEQQSSNVNARWQWRYISLQNDVCVFKVVYCKCHVMVSQGQVERILIQWICCLRMVRLNLLFFLFSFWTDCYSLCRQSSYSTYWE